MCGIVGFYNSVNPLQDKVECIKSMIAAIKHRGPDEAGYFVDDILSMGTARLSIIDLKSGTQPMCDSSQRYWLCYNGELYNYIELRKDLQNKGIKFKTSSDTEVVLEAWMYWKEKCLTKFNGAFAFSIYDSFEKSLFIGRDRYGKRPLFYTEFNGGIIFASEMKAFMSYPGFSFSFDQSQIASILGVWTPLPSQTAYKDIKQLPMGEYLTIQGKKCQRHKYESLNFENSDFKGDENEAIALVREELKKSVELRLRSDVEVGVYLSGGLDSSIVTYLTTQLSSHKVHTYSVEFADKKYDESSEQQELASHLGTSHSSVSIGYKDIVDNFPKAIFHAEMPAFRTAFVPMYMLSQHVKKQGVKVVLSGEGADEAFLGYDIFKDTILRRDWDITDNKEKLRKLDKMYPYLDHFGTKEHLLGLYQQFSKERMLGLFSHEMRFQNGRFSNRLLKASSDPFEHLYCYIAEEHEYSGLDAVQKTQWLEFKTLLSGYLLSTQGERMSMANSVENRCPFLDPNVVKVASLTNLGYNDGFNEKYLLKRAFADNLPSRIVNRPKNPYTAPDSSAFVNHKPDYLEALLSDNELKKLDFLNTKFTRALINKIFSNKPESISTKENQTFIFLLSIALLNQYFVDQTLTGSRDTNIDDILVRKIDRSTSNYEVSKK